LLLIFFLGRRQVHLVLLWLRKEDILLARGKRRRNVLDHRSRSQGNENRGNGFKIFLDFSWEEGKTIGVVATIVRTLRMLGRGIRKRDWGVIW